MRRAAGLLANLLRHISVPLTRQGRNSVIDFKQAGAALAAADAHRHHAPLGLAPASLLQDVARQTRARHAKGVADRDRAAVDVVLLGIDPELVTGIQALAGERLVEFPKI